MVAEQKPDVVVLAAAKVGGIHANNTFPADFLLENLKIQTHVIETAWKSGKTAYFWVAVAFIRNLLGNFLKEEALLTGLLEPTNESYAIAKIAGLSSRNSRNQYEFDAISLMPTNLYGPGDNYDSECHVLPALIRRFHDAKFSGVSEVTCWEVELH